jgi:hypothetical protein
MSNVVGSASAWEGALSQVLGHKGVRYDILRVGLLFYPRWLAVTSNEVKDFGNGTTAIQTETRRTLRTTSLLAGNRRTIIDRWPDGTEHKKVSAGVDFIVSFCLVTPSDEFEKYRGMLDRRLKNGHYWRQPYLGIRECPALVEHVTDFNSVSYPIDMPMIEHADGLKTADVNTNLGICFYGTDWDDTKRPNFFAPLRVTHGIVEYPTWEDARRLGIKREAA